MKHVNCILCNKNDTHLLVKKDSFNVVQCNGCRLVYLNPRLDAGELDRLYNMSEDSTLKRVAVSQKEVGHDTQKIKKFKLSIQLLKKHRKDIKNVFDLGCSTGIFLGMAAKEGWTSYGSDVNRNLVEENQKRYGDRVKMQDEDRIDFLGQYFDVVALFDVIEHLTDPITTLKEVSRVLKDNGFVVITTPNIAGLFPILTYNLLCRTVGIWEHPTPPRHIFQFSKKTLIKILEKAGFEWVDSRNYENFMPYTVGQLENSIINVLRKYDHNGKGVFSQHQVANNRLSTPCKGEKSGGIKKSNRNPLDIRPLSKNHNQEAQHNEAPECKNNYSSFYPFYLLNKLPRLLIRLSSFGMVASIYPLARILRMGDSMVVIAKKKT